MLPFDRKADLQDREGNTIASGVPVSLWPRSQSTTQVGEAVDLSGIASKAYAPELQKPNRILVIDGAKYTVTRAAPALMSPWVDLTVRRMGGQS